MKRTSLLLVLALLAVSVGCRRAYYPVQATYPSAIPQVAPLASGCDCCCAVETCCDSCDVVTSVPAMAAPTAPVPASPPAGYYQGQ